MNSNRRPYFGPQLLIIHCGKIIGHLQIIRKALHGFGFQSQPGILSWSEKTSY